jgi:prophage DNA circulation protein
VTMHSSLARVIGAVAIGLATGLGAPPTAGFAHEGHQMACTDSSINAMKADVQAMPDGKSKTVATREMEAAQDMMQKKDMKACMVHMHGAMEAIEK